MSWMRTAAVVVGLALLATGCGDDGPAGPDVVRQEETVERQPKLPRGWERVVNDTAGLEFGRPPGWEVAEAAVLTVIRAPDGLTVLSMTIDRTSEAIAEEPKSFVTRTAELLPGYSRPLDFSKPRRFAHRYEAAIVRASGVAEGVRQNVRVIALRRKGVATVTAVVAANAGERTGPQVRQALRALKTVRTRPPR